MEAWTGTVEETAQVWEQDGGAAGEVRESIGAVDETFLERMMRVFQAVPTGYMRQEAVADERTYATWKAWGDERLKALGTSGVSLVSDRAKALIQRAEQGIEPSDIYTTRPALYATKHTVKSSAITGVHFVTSSVPYGLLQRLRDPLGYVFASLLGSQNDLAMLLRRQADCQPLGEGLVWRFPTLGTKRQIVLNRICKCLAEFVD